MRDQGRGYKIIIVGGGIAGLTLASLLQDKHEVTLIERSTEWRSIGFIIGIPRIGLNILRKLKVSKSFWKKLYPIKNASYLDGDGNKLMNIDFNYKDEVSVKREDLHKEIGKTLKKVNVRFGTTVEKIINHKNLVEVTLSDGTTDNYDLLVGADGMRSKIRQRVFGKKLKNYGWSVIGMWTKPIGNTEPAYFFKREVSCTFLNLPYFSSCVLGYVYKNPTPNKRLKFNNINEVFEHFPRLKKLVDEFTYKPSEDTPIYTDSLTYVNLKEWFKNRVVLIGDAKHGMSLLSGMGTSLALEDAYILSQEIDKSQNLKVALNNFSTRRSKRIKSIQPFKNLVEKLGMIKGRVYLSTISFFMKFIPKNFGSRLLHNIFDTEV